MLEMNIHYFIEEFFKSVENRHENLDKKMEGIGFSFNHVSKLTIKYVKEKAAVNPKNSDDRYL